MADFDSRIILSGMQQGPSAFETMRSLQDLAARQQQMQQERSLADIYRQNAQNPAGLGQALMQGGHGREAMGWMGAQSEMERRNAAQQADLTKALQSYRERVSGLLYGTKDQADYERRLSSVTPQERALFPQTWEEAKPVVEAIAIPPAKRAEMEQEGLKFDETKRHNQAMESRPAAGGIPIVITGEGGAQLAWNPRAPSAPAAPIMGPDGKPIVKPAAGKQAALTKGDRDELANLRAERDSFDGLLKKFKPEFAGMGPEADLKIAAANKFGTMAPKKLQDLREFWAEFNRLVDLPARNKVFGASLSAGEKASWEGAKNIKPTVDYESAKAHMDQLRGIVDSKLRLRGKSLSEDGYRPGAIEVYTGPLGESPTPELGGESEPGTKSVTGYRYTKDRSKRAAVYSDGSQGPLEASNGE